ncbi:MAG: energy transducer TonB [Ostreibacterium sp.]
MRHMIAFLGSLLFHGVLFASVLSFRYHQIPVIDRAAEQVVNFELGMMMSVNTAEINQSVASEAMQLKSTTDSSELVTKLEPTVKTELVVEQKVIKVKSKPKPPSKKELGKKKIISKLPKKQKPEKKVKPKADKKLVPWLKAQLVIGQQVHNQVKSIGESSASKGGKSKITESDNIKANTYKAGLQVAIARVARRHYPRAARRMHKEGVVMVRFHLGRDGYISQIQLLSSSGNSHLDKAAVIAIKRLGQYKIPPAGFPSVLTVPIHFSLR